MRNFLLFLVTAGLTTYCLGQLLPPVTLPTLDLKLAAYAQQKNECNVLVLGTSQTFYGLDPSLFDARTKEHGVDTRTFNLGDLGGGLAVLHGHLRRVAEMEPQGLRWVLVEAERVMRVGDEGGFLTHNVIATTDLETALLLWPFFGEVEPRLERRAHARWRTVLALVYRLIGVGRGTRWLEHALGMGATAQERLHAIGPRGDGYVSLEDLGRERIQERPNTYRNRQRQMERRAQRVLRTRGLRDPATRSALPFYSRIEELGRSLGAEVVFFTIRQGVGVSDARALASEGAIDALIEFDDPQRYPELYDVDMTLDGGHFNRAGAQHFTLHMADAFAELVKSRTQ